VNLSEWAGMSRQMMIGTARNVPPRWARAEKPRARTLKPRLHFRERKAKRLRRAK
jgi:hypothetical protein